MSKQRFLVLIIKLMNAGYSIDKMQVLKIYLNSGDGCFYTALKVEGLHHFGLSNVDNAEKKYNELFDYFEWLKYPLSKHDYL